MKNAIIGLTLLMSMSAMAQNSIELKMSSASGFDVDTYNIPSTSGESPEESLLILANVLPRDACYNGKVKSVKKMLDFVVTKAKNVKKYTSFASKTSLSVDLTVYNQNLRKNQRNQLVVEKCK